MGGLYPDSENRPSHSYRDLLQNRNSRYSQPLNFISKPSFFERVYEFEIHMDELSVIRKLGRVCFWHRATFPTTRYIGQVPGRGVFFGVPMSCSTRFSTPLRITPTENAGRVTWGLTHNHLIVG